MRFIVTGTDTNVGKTVFAAALAGCGLGAAGGVRGHLVQPGGHIAWARGRGYIGAGICGVDGVQRQKPSH